MNPTSFTSQSAYYGIPEEENLQKLVQQKIGRKPTAEELDEDLKIANMSNVLNEEQLANLWNEPTGKQFLEENFDKEELRKIYTRDPKVKINITSQDIKDIYEDRIPQFRKKESPHKNWSILDRFMTNFSDINNPAELEMIVKERVPDVDTKIENDRVWMKSKNKKGPWHPTDATIARYNPFSEEFTKKGLGREFLGDVADITGATIKSIPSIAASAKTAAMTLSAPYRAVPMLTAMAASGAVGAASDTISQLIQKYSGYRKDIDPANIITEGVANFLMPAVFGTGVSKEAIKDEVKKILKDTSKEGLRRLAERYGMEWSTPKTIQNFVEGLKRSQRGILERGYDVSVGGIGKVITRVTTGLDPSVIRFINENKNKMMEIAENPMEYAGNLARKVLRYSKEDVDDVANEIWKFKDLTKNIPADISPLYASFRNDIKIIKDELKSSGASRKQLDKMKSLENFANQLLVRYYPYQTEEGIKYLPRKLSNQITLGELEKIRNDIVSARNFFKSIKEETYKKQVTLPKADELYKKLKDITRTSLKEYGDDIASKNPSLNANLEPGKTHGDWWVGTYDKLNEDYQDVLSMHNYLKKRVFKKPDVGNAKYEFDSIAYENFLQMNDAKSASFRHKLAKYDDREYRAAVDEIEKIKDPTKRFLEEKKLEKKLTMTDELDLLGLYDITNETRDNLSSRLKGAGMLRDAGQIAAQKAGYLSRQGSLIANFIVAGVEPRTIFRGEEFVRNMGNVRDILTGAKIKMPVAQELREALMKRGTYESGKYLYNKVVPRQPQQLIEEEQEEY